MAKIDKTGLTKEEYRKLKQEKNIRKLEKQHARRMKENPAAGKISILCLKHGSKYDASYVNKLYAMVQKHCTLPFNFFCATEDREGIDKGVNIIPLPKSGMNGWWFKPWLFSNETGLREGTILYMDLDVVIANNIDRLLTHRPGAWLICRDFTRSMRPNWDRFNSSVMRWEAGQHEFIYTNFIGQASAVMRKFHGDQDWIWDQGKEVDTFFPDEWIRSWKWEIRKTKHFKPGGTRGNRVLEKIENVVPDKNVSICVFHGDPNPHRCEDPWVVENWHNV